MSDNLREHLLRGKVDRSIERAIDVFLEDVDKLVTSKEATEQEVTELLAGCSDFQDAWINYLDITAEEAAADAERAGQAGLSDPPGTVQV